MDQENPVKEASDIRHATADKLRQGIDPDPPDRFLLLPVSLKNKYVKLEFEDLFRRNAKTTGQAQQLVVALKQLYVIGRELLKPINERSEEYDCISLADNTYLTLLRDIKGHMYILNFLGYKEVSGTLVFENNQSVLEEKSELIAELYLAQHELSCFLKGEHFYEDQFWSLLPILKEPEAVTMNGHHRTIPPNMDMLTPEELQSPGIQMEVNNVLNPNQHIDDHPIIPATEDRGLDLSEQSARESIANGSPLPQTDIPETNIHESRLGDPGDTLKTSVEQSVEEDYSLREAPEPDIRKLDEETSGDWIEDELRCQHCQFINLPDAELCISCAEPLDFSAPPANHGPPATETGERTVRCPYCTYQNTTGASLCSMCSRTLSSEENICQEIRNGACAEDVPIERECPVCTYMNPISTNICLMCYSSVIGPIDSGEFEVINEKQTDSSTRKDAMLTMDPGNADPGKRQDHSEVNTTVPHNAVGKLLPDNNIYCPVCFAVCDIELGAFSQRKCYSCSLQFCDGCKRSFLQGCGKTKDCTREPHCHHPRDCLFYVSMCSRTKLKGLLKEKHIRIKRQLDWLEQEALRRGCDEEEIKQEHKRGFRLCDPYTEYIVNVIKENQIDPAPAMSKEVLKVIIRKELNQDPCDISESYLLEYVQEHLPLR